jgi:hypothetical protein
VELEKSVQKMSALQRGWSNLTKGFTLPNIGTTLATALGINLQSISANVARFITGMSKQEEDALKKLEELSTQVADKNIANMRALLSEEQRYQLALEKREQLNKAIADRTINSTEDLVALKRAELELANRTAEIQAYELKLAEQQKKEFEKMLAAKASANERAFQVLLSELETNEKIRILKVNIADIEAMLRNGIADKNTVEQFGVELQQRRNELAVEEARLRKETAEKERERAEEHIAAMDKLVELKFQRLSVDQKIAKLAAQEAEITENVRKMKRDKVDSAHAEVALMETQNQLAELRQQKAEALAKTEDERTAELARQLKLLDDQLARLTAISRTGRDYEAQSTTALEGALGRARRNLQDVKEHQFQTGFDSPADTLLAFEIRRMESELASRRTVSNFAERHGEEAARRQFGDTATEQALRDVQTEAKRTTQAVESISERLRKLLNPNG